MHKHFQNVFEFSQVVGHLIATIGLLISAAGVQAEAVADLDSDKEIPAGARISSITIDRDNIFNLTNSKEDNALYRLINRLHIVTREDTIEKQLLFADGDQYTQRLIDESERILRGNKYLYDATITSTVNEAGNVDLKVWSRDIWTLTPQLTLSRSGGENKTAFGIEESNLLGRGQRLEATWAKDVERSSITVEFSDRQFMHSWVALDLLVADNSDGHSHQLSAVKPFYAIDARDAGGLTAYDDDRRSTFYDLGDEAAEYRHERKSFVAFGGFSGGLKNGWVRRWTYGAAYDDNHFLPVQEPTLPEVIPPDRKLVYPFIGIEILEDRFEKSANSNQIDRVEDFFLGTRLALTLGWSNTGFGADRDALIYTLTANYSYGSMKHSALLLSGGLRGRDETGTLANATADLSARLYLRQSERLLFFTQVTGVLGHNLDEDQPVEIGGDTGLRGYPLRYQSGESSLVVSIEQRYFTNWYPFRLVRVGAAVFADTGRVWGPNVLNSPNLGWLSDVGFGFRFAPTRLGTKKVFHLDIAFPLGGDEDIDTVQVLFSAKSSF